jgi:hypothetical protein
MHILVYFFEEEALQFIWLRISLFHKDWAPNSEEIFVNWDDLPQKAIESRR